MPVEHDIKSFAHNLDGPGCEDNASSTDAPRCYNLALDTPNITEDVLSSFNEDHFDATSVVFFSDKATEGVFYESRTCSLRSDLTSPANRRKSTVARCGRRRRWRRMRW